ncbi:beta-ketoacyl-ACP synthase III [Sutterella sp.]|uniref:beta-ketoacyl-ACP synthase III n=1 Tax=Sutterella sp. TaxID=1981025 RepID=UPI0026E10FDE|nr:beta-ketoacyl-ACP synthase III [Sutterella sp.]MDO5531089.1 beta-ketoacyl-ACP synthase III [Sutterella sp.]
MSMYSRIAATGSALPETRVTNAELATRLAARGVETNDEWIRTRTGIEARRFCDPEKGETTTSLAARAGAQALERAGFDPATIDLIIVATTTPDMVFPSTAAHVQSMLGCAGCAAFDVQAVCAGFIYALNAADAMLRAGPYRRALVIGAETMSRVIDFDDRSTCVLFGDGAGAVALEASDAPGILAARMYADGRYDENVLGLTACLSGGAVKGSPFLNMDGRMVFKLAVEGLTGSAEEVAKLAGVSPSEVKLFVPHQANLRIMTMVARKLGIPDDVMVKTVSEHGNTSAASVPLALDAAVTAGRVKDGDLVLLQAVGAGMAWGSAILRWRTAP